MLRHDGIPPRRAPVVPRCFAGPGSEAISLERRLRELIDSNVSGRVLVRGAAGAGKTTALRHLAAALPANADICLIDSDNPAHHRARLYVHTGENALVDALVAFDLAPWGPDDWIEYLAGTHRTQVSSVMRRIDASPDRARLDGCPELWSVVLEEMSNDPAVGDVRGALLHWLRMHVPAWEAVCTACVDEFGGELDPDTRAKLLRGAVVRQRIVQIWLAAQKLAGEVEAVRATALLKKRFTRELCDEAAHLIRARAKAVEHLKEVVEGPDEDAHAQAASILILADPNWRLRDGPSPCLEGAQLRHAKWARIKLIHPMLDGADLSGADLSDAALTHAHADKTCFNFARLGGAVLTSSRAIGAQFACADLRKSVLRHCALGGARFMNADLRETDLSHGRLSGANFTGANLAGALLREASLTAARFENADLRDADVSRAHLENVNWTDAKLDRAMFVGARLHRANLEGLSANGANFSRAELAGAYLTGSSMRQAIFAGADLRETGLAEVDWEEADLRDADLRGASFHMGTTRCGLVGSVIPCEGSKTGFYTDDYNEREYAPAEQIRKANLCGVDLRGARIDGVDFYLVDLRGALYTEDQELVLRQTGAILDE